MQLTASLNQVRPSFVLATGLLLIGAVANRDGLFEQADAAMQRLARGGVCFSPRLCCWWRP